MVSSPPEPVSAMQADQLEATTSPSRVFIGLLANICRVFTQTPREAPIRDGETLGDFDRDQLPTAGRGATG